MILLALLIAQASEQMPATVRTPKETQHLHAIEGQLTGNKPTVSADDVVDEMMDEFAADVAKLGAAHVAPILIDRVRVSPNMNPAYAGVIEARLAAAVSRAASMAMVRCVECTALRSRVDNGEWVVARGLTTKEEAQAVAKKYGARSFLDVSVALDPPASLAMNVEMVRADDSSIAFAEQYRMDGEHALLYRGADHAQSREARLKELEDRVNQRPRWGQLVQFGTMLMPADSGNSWGAVGKYTLTEAFGETGSMAAGISLGGFLDSSLAGGILTATVQTRLTDGNVFTPQWYLAFSAGGFVTGNAGNSPIFGAEVRWLAASRVAFYGSASYLIPFQLHNRGDNFGGLCPSLGVSFVWN